MKRLFHIITALALCAMCVSCRFYRNQKSIYYIKNLTPYAVFVKNYPDKESESDFGIYIEQGETMLFWDQADFDRKVDQSSFLNIRYISSMVVVEKTDGTELCRWIDYEYRNDHDFFLSTSWHWSRSIEILDGEDVYVYEYTYTIMPEDIAAED